MPPSASPATVPTPTRDRIVPPAQRGDAPSARPRAGALTGRVLRMLRGAAPALLGYAAVRLLGVLVLAQWAHLKGHGLWPQLAAQWDSKWYLGIADHGYHPFVPEMNHGNNLAFFPLYPMVVKAVAGVTPGSRATVGMVIAIAASLIAAWGIFAVGDRIYGRRVGTALAVLWGCTPVALVQWMGYTESLFTALLAWSLNAVLTGRWVWAGTLAALAGLTRPTGAAIAAAVTISALLALWRLRGTEADRGTIGRIALGGALAPLGWLGFITWVGVRAGRWDGYFAVQKTWTNQWDGGVETLRSLRDLIAYQSRPQLFLVGVSAVLITACVLFLFCLGARQPLPLLVFSGVLLLIVLGSGGVYFPRARFLLPGFPLLLPFAVALARARRRIAVPVLVSAALFSAYFGAYMALVYTGAP